MTLKFCLKVTCNERRKWETLLIDQRDLTTMTLQVKGHNYSFSKISRKLLEIETLFVLITYRKSYISFHLVP